MKKYLLALTGIAVVISCEKKENVESKKVNPVPENKVEQTSDSVIIPEEDSVSLPTGFQDEISGADVQEYKPKKGKLLKFTEQYDTEGNEIIVISENGKKDLWLYKSKKNPSVYELRSRGITLTKDETSYTLTRNGTTSTYNKK